MGLRVLGRYRFFGFAGFGVFGLLGFFGFGARVFRVGLEGFRAS